MQQRAEGRGGGYILIVEDSETQARQLDMIVRQLGYRTAVAYDGRRALDMLKNEKAILVIADILMPGMDGYELCKIIKSDENLMEVPVVLLTQLSDPKEIVRGLACGSDDFVVKPYNEELLLTRIKAILSSKLHESRTAKQVKILIVEDSPTQAEQLKHVLDSQGYTAYTAFNGKDGIELARKLKPTIIISDILMPVMDGYELAYEVKHDPELKNIPVILITSLMDRKEIVRRAAVVADGFFTKPYDDKYLIAKIKALLGTTYHEAAATDIEPIGVSFGGEKYEISSGRRQILTFLLSTYENAVHQNQDLIHMHRELQLLNEQLEERVIERTHQLQATEARYRTLLETSVDAHVVIGGDGTIYFANKAAESLLGKKREELVGKPFQFTVLPGETMDVEIAPGGRERTVAEMRVAQTTWGDEKACLATLRDITGRRQMEQALRESEENFRALAENADVGILISIGDNRYVFANKRAGELTGYSLDEILRLGVKDIAHPDAWPEVAERIRKRFDGIQVPSQLETFLRRKDGKKIPIELTSSGTSWHGQKAILVLFRDITERRIREEELIRARKLESLGILAGGIAHDFNNLLTGIVGNASLIKSLIGPQDKIYRILSELEKASLRAKDLTHQLLTFAKGGSPVKKAASIAELVKESALFVLRGSNIKCEFDMPGDLWPLEVDEGQISQVIHNLVLNAEQAMPEGGYIRIALDNVTTGPDDNLPLEAGRYVRIMIKDMGVGISEKNLSRIFDPYFTTKEDGSGLGLATVYSIIKNHGGHITAESEVGAGTTFRIFMPVAERAAAEPARMNNDEKITNGTGRVLVMDDEEIVRDVVKSILEELGYRVDEALDGEQAVRMYASAAKEARGYAAVIMDLTIPGAMGGKDAVKKLIEIDPDVRAIVSSGYSEDAIMAEYRKYGFRAVIAKPYKVSELSRVVNDVAKKKA